MGGAFQALEGLAGIVHDQWLVVLPNYIYAFDLTVWDVLHLLVGLGVGGDWRLAAERSDMGAHGGHHCGGDFSDYELRLDTNRAVVGADGDRR